MINNFSPEAVINSGSAGGMDTKLDVLDIVVSSELAYHDVDVTVFNYEYGQMCGMPARYTADERLVKLAADSVAELKDLKSVIGLICSGDSFISCPEHTANIRKNFPDVMAVEMEGASIAHTCFLLHTPFVVIRAISDIPGKDSNYKDFKDFLLDAGKISAQMVVNIIKNY
jgi:adenosylhomocysteine nucleosidase